MVSEDELRNAISYLEEFGYNNPRIDGSFFRVGEEPNDIISIPVDQIEEVDTPDDKYTSWVKLHLENTIEKTINVFDIDRPAAGQRMFDMFKSSGNFTISFMENGNVNMERLNTWSTTYEAYK